MTKKERDEIASYVAQNFIGPLCFSKESTKENYLRMSGVEFNKFFMFLDDMIKEDEHENN